MQCSQWRHAGFLVYPRVDEGLAEHEGGDSGTPARVLRELLCQEGPQEGAEEVHPVQSQLVQQPAEALAEVWHRPVRRVGHLVTPPDAPVVLSN